MKRIALFITIIMIISIFLTSVSAYGLKFDEDSVEGKSIACVDFLDFNEKNNNWAMQDETGKWVINPDTDNDWDENNDWLPRQAYAPMNKTYGAPKYTNDKLEWSLTDNGEVLHVESISPSLDPGITFIMDADHQNIGIGKETNGKMEYCKIRIKNYSNSKQFTLGFIESYLSHMVFFTRTVTDVPVESNSSEWITYTFSVPEYNKNTNYCDSLRRDNDGNLISRWEADLFSILIFPFGYNVENGEGAYEGAIMDIDYIVFGSKEYVTSYQSDLEKKENDFTSIKIIKEPENKIYHVGEKIDLEGLEVEATHRDGTKRILKQFNVTYDFSKPSENAEVRIGYIDYNGSNIIDEYYVKVIGISEIKLESGPENLQYHLIFAEDEMKNTDIKLRVVYDDGKYSIIDLEDTKYNYDFSTPGEKNVNLTYLGSSYSFKVNVSNLESIRIDSLEKYINLSDIIIDNVVCIFEDGVEKTLTLKPSIAKTIIDYKICDLKTTELSVRLIMEKYGIDIETKKMIETKGKIKFIFKQDDGVQRIYNCGEKFNENTIKLYYEIYNELFELGENEYDIDYDFSTAGTKTITITDKKYGKKIFLSAYVRENPTVTSEETSTNTESQITTDNVQVPENNNISLIIIISCSTVIIVLVTLVIIITKNKKKTSEK